VKELVGLIVCDGEATVNSWSGVTVADGPDADLILVGVKFEAFKFFG
jgi:hypothetical protein